MTSKLFLRGAHEIPDEFEAALSQAQSSCQPQLSSPLQISTAPASDRPALTQAILFAILTQPPSSAAPYIDHLTTITSDGYASLVALLLRLVTDSYPRLLEQPRGQVLWILKHLIGFNATDADNLCLMLLRQLVGGDLTPTNIWLGTQMLEVLNSNVPWLTGNPGLLTGSVYTYLRLLADHSNSKSSALNELRQAEIKFCCTMLREHFQECMAIGRDLVRLLQDVALVPELEPIWRDLLANPGSFKAPGFTDISQLYLVRTPTKYFQSRLTPEAEAQIKFMLTSVRMGNQRRYQTWFNQKFLASPECETLVVDVIRYVCCVHHPSNQILQSDILPRWALIGWLLKCCKSNHVEANAKLALLYDWLFFVPKADNIMNIEPGLLVMVHSIPKYSDMTNALLEFLFLLMDHYDPPRKEIVQRGVAASFDILVGKGVVRSLEPLSGAPAIAGALREKLVQMFPVYCRPEGAAEGFKAKLPGKIEAPLVAAAEEKPEAPEGAGSPENPGRRRRRAGGGVHDELQLQVEKLSKALASSSQDGAIQVLESSLNGLVSQDRAEKFASQISEITSKVGGYQLFTALAGAPTNAPEGDETMSITSTLIRLYVGPCYPHVKSMLLHWHREGLPVGARLLCYVSRLAEELEMKDLREPEPRVEPPELDDGEASENLSRKRLKRSSSSSKQQKSLQARCVDAVADAFKAYEEFLRAIAIQARGSADDDQLRLSLLGDLNTCLVWNISRVQRVIPSVFRYLPGLAIGDEELMQLAVSVLNPAGMLSLELKLSLGELRVIGGLENASKLIKTSLGWDSLEQNSFWRLLVAEIQSSGEFSLAELVRMFGSAIPLSPEADVEAVSGLLLVLRSSPPTSALCSALLGLPGSFGKLVIGVFSSWLLAGFPGLISALSEEQGMKPEEKWPSFEALVNHLEEFEASRSQESPRVKQAGEIRQALLRLVSSSDSRSESSCVT